METKICSKCGLEKELTEFHKCSKGKDGFKCICKSCISINNKLNIEKNRERSKKWSLKNPNAKIRKNEKRKQQYNDNKEIRKQILKINKKWRLNNKNKIKENNIIYQQKNKEKLKIKKKEYREKNKEKVNESTRKWIVENYDYYMKKNKEYRSSEKGLKNKRENYYKNKDINKYIIAWRSVLSNTLKRFGTKKEGHTIKLLGYSAIELKEHLENKFMSGMTWDNWGEWHIDHIKPVSSFNINEKMSVVNSLNNLQPLWANDNLKKSNKIVDNLKNNKNG